jgi:hypothetical protein
VRTVTRIWILRIDPDQFLASVERGSAKRQDLDDWLARTPLIEIVFDDERLRTSSSARSR